MYQDLPELPDRFAPFMKLLEKAEEQPLSEREKEMCRERIDVVFRYAVMMDKGLSPDSEQMRALSRQIARPLVSENGQTVAFSTAHLAWTLDQALLKRLFENQAELEEAKAQTENYFRDGKPFTFPRWPTVRMDVAKAAVLGEMGRLN